MPSLGIDSAKYRNVPKVQPHLHKSQIDAVPTEASTLSPQGVLACDVELQAASTNDQALEKQRRPATVPENTTPAAMGQPSASLSKSLVTNTAPVPIVASCTEANMNADAQEVQDTIKLANNEVLSRAKSCAGETGLQNAQSCQEIQKGPSKEVSSSDGTHLPQGGPTTDPISDDPMEDPSPADKTRNDSVLHGRAESGVRTTSHALGSHVVQPSWNEQPPIVPLGLEGQSLEADLTDAPTNDKHQGESRRDLNASPPKRVRFSEPFPYAIVSLFDGVGSGMSAVIRAIGYPPCVFIAAECDPVLRQLVGEQFKIRTDGKWSKPNIHCHAVYFNDVRAILAHQCKVLREAFALAGPECRWIVIAGSPCQDPTLAGPLGGLLGLTGRCSSLFYYVHVSPNEFFGSFDPVST